MRGESHITRPAFDQSDDRAWAEYLYFRKNPKGVHFERWLHLHGCRQWFNLARDTRTHAIRAVYWMGERPPEMVP